MPSKNGGYYDIESNENGLEIRLTHPNTEYWTFNGKDILPGFDENGDSWLFNSLSVSEKPGKVISAIESAYKHLNLQTVPDIDWLNWLNAELPLNKGKVWWQQPKHHNEQSLENLYKLLEETIKLEPSLADVIMLGQLQDCYEQLGISQAT